MNQPATKEIHPLWADVPIERPADDQLGRVTFAASLAKTIRSMQGSESFVFGICGPWGCGKSSILRMVVNDLQSNGSEPKPVVVTFNPWWFSGQDQLLRSFLSQLAAVIGKRNSGEGLNKLGKGLSTFAKVLRPVGWVLPAVKDAAEAIDSGADAVTILGERLTADVYRLRAEIDDELRKSQTRIVIVMDDIDRLTATEISQLFAIVKAVADFPNTVYLLSYDHSVVCEAIKQALGLNGPSYLEKIVQIRVDVPPPSPIMLHQMFLGQLDGLIPTDQVNDPSRKAFGNLFHGGIKTFFKTPRSVKSLTNVLRVLFPAVAGEVNWPDFVALTVLQVFAPDVYRTIRDNRERFAGHNDHSWARDDRDEEKKFHQTWLDRVSENERAAVSEIVRRLFPKAGTSLGGNMFGADWASQWEAELRVCSPECFDRYFQFQVPTGAISEAEWRQFVGVLDSADTIDAAIRRWGHERGPNGVTSRAKVFLERLSLFAQHGATAEQAKSLLAAVIRNGELLISIEDDDRSSLLPIDNELRISWAVQHLLERIPEGAERDQELERALSAAGLLTTTKLVWLFGAQHGLFGSSPKEPGHPPHVSRDCVNRLQSMVLSKLRTSARDGSLAANQHALLIAHDWQSFDGSEAAKEWVASVCQDDETLVRFLFGVQSPTSSHSADDHVATVSKSAAADFLVHWLDGKALRTRCQRILEQNESWLTADLRAAVQLVVDSLDESGNPLDPFRRGRSTAKDHDNEQDTAETTDETNDLDDNSQEI